MEKLKSLDMWNNEWERYGETGISSIPAMLEDFDDYNKFRFAPPTDEEIIEKFKWIYYIIETEKVDRLHSNIINDRGFVVLPMDKDCGGARKFALQLNRELKLDNRYKFYYRTYRQVIDEYEYYITLDVVKQFLEYITEKRNPRMNYNEGDGITF